MLCLALAILPAASDNSARVDKLGHKVICMCGCEQVLLECNHYECPYLTPERRELIAAVDGGKSDQDILSAFVNEYGPTVLAAPPYSGFNRLVWLAPYAALVFGILLVAFIVRAWRNRPLPATAGVPARVVGAELDRFRAQARKETDL